MSDFFRVGREDRVDNGFIWIDQRRFSRECKAVIFPEFSRPGDVMIEIFYREDYLAAQKRGIKMLHGEREISFIPQKRGQMFISQFSAFAFHMTQEFILGREVFKRQEHGFCLGERGSSVEQ